MPQRPLPRLQSNSGLPEFAALLTGRSRKHPITAIARIRSCIQRHAFYKRNPRRPVFPRIDPANCKTSRCPVARYQQTRLRHLRALPQRTSNPSPSSPLSAGPPRTSAKRFMRAPGDEDGRRNGRASSWRRWTRAFARGSNVQSRTDESMRLCFT